MLTRSDDKPPERPRGRPLVPIDPARLRALAAQGMTVAGIAVHLGLSGRRLLERVAADPRLRQAVDEGRATAIDVASHTVFQAARNGDTAAAKWYLTHVAGWSRRRAAGSEPIP